MVIKEADKNIYNALWKRVQLDDKDAFHQLYEITVSTLTSISVKFNRDTHETKDILQEVYVSLYMRRHTLPADLNVFGYLRNAVKFRLSNNLRNQMRRKGHLVALLRENKVDQQIFSFPEEKNELGRYVEMTVNRLPDKCRQVFILNKYEGLSYKQISCELGISVKTVEKHISKATQLLRNNLTPVFNRLISVAISLTSLF